jgi:hypothetical protein
MMAMNEPVAQALIDSELHRLEKLPYAELAALIGKVETKEVIGEDGKTYQIEIQVFWDGRKAADIRVMVAADDRGWRAFRPLTGDFIMRPNGSLI